MGKTRKKLYSHPRPTSERREALDVASLEIEYQEWSAVSDNIFIIVEESRPSGSEFDLLDLQGSYYFTWREAHDALTWMAANDYNVEVRDVDGYFEVPTPPAGFEYQSYYIEELVRG